MKETEALEQVFAQGQRLAAKKNEKLPKRRSENEAKRISRVAWVELPSYLFLHARIIKHEAEHRVSVRRSCRCIESKSTEYQFPFLSYSHYPYQANYNYNYNYIRGRSICGLNLIQRKQLMDRTSTIEPRGYWHPRLYPRYFLLRTISF